MRSLRSPWLQPWVVHNDNFKWKEDDYGFSIGFFIKDGKLQPQLEDYYQYLGKRCGDLNGIKECIDFVINTLLYLTSADILVKRYLPSPLNFKGTSSKKQAKFDRTLSTQSRLPFYTLGEDFVFIKPPDVKIIKSDHVKESDIHRKSPIEHYVGEHWREQACGVGLKDRRLILISEFKRGKHIKY